MEKYLLLILVVIALGVLLYFVYKKQKRKKLITKYRDILQQLLESNQDMEAELERTKLISKNDEGIKLFKSWSVSNQENMDHLEQIKQHVKELDQLNTNQQHQEFLQVSGILEGLIFDYDANFDILFKKVKKYTSFESENMRISITLHERIKNITRQFEVNLKYLEIYNNSFNSEILRATSLINEFENKQNDGDYPEGRNILKRANTIIEDIEYSYKIISNFQEYLLEFQADIDNVNTINKEIENIGFKINVSDFDLKMDKFKIRRQELLEDITGIDFENKFSAEKLNSLKNKSENLDRELTEFKNIVEEKFKFISDIMNIMAENEELIKTAEEVIGGAKLERDEIIKLYELPNISQIKTLDSYFEEYSKFINDYEKLLNIIHNAKEDYARLKDRMTKSNHYLIRLLKNLKTSINELRAIRQDEIKASENISDFKALGVEMDLYLRKYDHKGKLSHTQYNLIDEYNTKLVLLEEELNKEPLDIELVRSLNDALITVGKTLSEKELESNIKQRLGGELLIKYLNQYNDNEDVNLLIKRLQNLYNNNDYRTLLSESYNLLQANSQKADLIYKEIVKQVDVEPFAPVLEYK